MNRTSNGLASRAKDWKYNRNKMDTPPPVDVRASITEARHIYSSMTDQAFAKWYAERYGVDRAAVLAFISRGRG